MSAINFPSNPTSPTDYSAQDFIDQNGRAWRWDVDATIWVLANAVTADLSNYLPVRGGTITDNTSAASEALSGSALTINQTWNTTGTPAE